MLLDIGSIASEEFYRIKCDVRTAGNKLMYGVIGVNRAIGMCSAMKFFVSKPHLVERTCCGANTVFSKNAKCAPQGIGFECHNYFSATLLHHIGDEIEIFAEFVLVDDVIWGFIVCHILFYNFKFCKF